MKGDTFRVTATYLIAAAVLSGGFYALVIYPFELDDLVKGAVIGFMSAALSFAFGQDIAKTTAASTTKSLTTTIPPNGDATPSPWHLRQTAPIPETRETGG